MQRKILAMFFFGCNRQSRRGVGIFVLVPEFVSFKKLDSVVSPDLEYQVVELIFQSIEHCDAQSTDLQVETWKASLERLMKI